MTFNTHPTWVCDTQKCFSPIEQAIDRVHRIGQRKPVRVVRLVIDGTIEQKIIKLQQKKVIYNKPDNLFFFFNTKCFSHGFICFIKNTGTNGTRCFRRWYDQEFQVNNA